LLLSQLAEIPQKSIFMLT